MLGIVAVIAVVTGLLFYTRARPPTRPARHVIVISLDTTRADHFGCYGNTWIRTPRIDTLATESILFTDYLTVTSTTLSSHVSLFTGKYPHTHGVPRNGFVVSPDNVMLAESLKDAGFRTAGFLGSFALASRFNFAQGFDHFDETFDILVGERGAQQNERRAEAVTDAVTGYLDREGVPPNLFLFVHYFDPHMQYDPPPAFAAMYRDTIAALGPSDHPALARKNRPPKARRLLARYAGEVSYMDHHVGRLLDDLKRRKILDHALLILTSDHGENLGDVPGRPFDHGWTTYQAVMHGVCLIRLPRAKHGGMRLDLPVASIDILPTVLSYLGLPMPAGVEGTVLDLASPSASLPSRPRFGEATKPWENVETDPRWTNMRKPRCVRLGRFKFIQTPYRGTEELYDLAADQHERVNLLENPTATTLDQSMNLRKLLEAWAESANPLPSRFESSQRAETIRRLQALGYLSPGDEDDEQERNQENRDEDGPP